MVIGTGHLGTVDIFCGICGKGLDPSQGLNGKESWNRSVSSCYLFSRNIRFPFPGQRTGALVFFRVSLPYVQKSLHTVGEDGALILVDPTILRSSRNKATQD